MESTIFPTERRQLPDRRLYPTSFWNALCPRGQRRMFRRVGEGRNAYVDALTFRAVFLTLLVMFCSIADALLTLLYLQSGGSELNPLMRAALDHSIMTFIGIKIGLTSLCTWFLAAHQQFPLAFRALHAFAVVYLVLLGIHAGLIWGGG